MSEPIAIIIAAVLAAIISLITVAASVATVALSNRLSSDAKSKEIKLLNYHKDRIDAVKTLYGLVVELSFANNYLFYTNSDNWGHADYENALNRWLSAYSQIYTYYNKNRILLLEKSKLSTQIRSSLNELSVILNAIRGEKNNLDELEEIYGGQLTYYYYTDQYDEIDKIRLRLAQLKNTPNLDAARDSFNTIRENLESYFHELTI